MTNLHFAARRAAPVARASAGATAFKTRLARDIAAPAFVAALACCPLSPAFAQDGIVLPEVDVDSASEAPSTGSGERISSSRLRNLQAIGHFSDGLIVFLPHRMAAPMVF